MERHVRSFRPAPTPLRFEENRMIAVVDYHKGNLKSVERGLIGVGGDARITDDAAAIAAARGGAADGGGRGPGPRSTLRR